MSTTTEKQRTDDAQKFAERHLSRAPDFTHALCGVPRGNRPLRPDVPRNYATCVVCRGLAGMS